MILNQLPLKSGLVNLNLLPGLFWAQKNHYSVSALWTMIDWGTDVQTLVATYYPVSRQCDEE